MRKMILEETEFPLEDGTLESVEEAEKALKDHFAEVNKTINNSEKEVDNINNAEAKELKEMLILEEDNESIHLDFIANFNNYVDALLKEYSKSVDLEDLLEWLEDAFKRYFNVLTESLNEDTIDYNDAHYNEFLADFAAILDKLLNKYSEVPLEELVSWYEEAYYKFVDSVDIEDYYESLNNLNEALPKELADIFKKHTEGTGVNKGLHSYKQINLKPNIDFQNSEYTVITPDEAKALKAEGKADEVLAIFDGQLVSFNKNGNQVYKATRSYTQSNADLYRRPQNGLVANYSTDLTFKTIVERAEKLYRASEVAIDSALRAQRATNPESKYTGYDKSNIRNLADDKKRGSKPGSDISISMYKNYIHEYETKRDHNLELANTVTTDERKKVYLDNAKYFDQQVNHYTKLLNNELNNTKDYNARIRYLASESDLQTIFNLFKRTKESLQYQNYKVKRAQEEVDLTKTSGSEQTRLYKAKLKKIQDEIKLLQKELDKYEVYLIDSEEVDKEALNKVENVLKDATEEQQALQKEFDAIMRRNTSEALEESAKIIKSFDSYEPWSGAVDTYDKIINANKLDELDNLIEELYPEGIEESQLNDLLWFEGDFVLDQLGIPTSDEDSDE